MNLFFAGQINPFLEKADFRGALAIAEKELGALSRTPFHGVIGESLLHQVNSLVDWIDHFFEKMEKRIGVKALYLEMTEFDIITAVWQIEGFAYSKDGGLEDTDWLSSVTRNRMTSESFVIRGFEKLQLAFEQTEPRTEALQTARDWCEQIIIVRFMELFHAAHHEANRKKLPWAMLPLYGTEHAYDFITKSANF